MLTPLLFWYVSRADPHSGTLLQQACRVIRHLLASVASVGVCLLVSVRLEAEEFRSLPRADLLATRGRAIIDKYLAAEASRPLVLPESVRAKVLAMAEAELVGPGLFIDAGIHVREPRLPLTNHSCSSSPELHCEAAAALSLAWSPATCHPFTTTFLLRHQQVYQWMEAELLPHFAETAAYEQLLPVLAIGTRHVQDFDLVFAGGSTMNHGALGSAPTGSGSRYGRRA